MIDLTKHLQDLKGRKYLPVAPRVVAFREEHPDWAITTAIVDGEPRLVRATIVDADGRVVATAHKTVTHFPGGDVEKAETGAIGRALSLCGYGTLLALDLDEGEEIADAPIEKPAHKPAAKPNGGRKYPPMKPEEIPQGETYVGTWKGEIEFTGTDTAALLEMLPKIAAETDMYRRGASLRLWVKAFSSCATLADLATAGETIRAWPEGTPSRAELLDLLRAAYKLLQEGTR